DGRGRSGGSRVGRRRRQVAGRGHDGLRKGLRIGDRSAGPVRHRRYQPSCHRPFRPACIEVRWGQGITSRSRPGFVDPPRRAVRLYLEPPMAFSAEISRTNPTCILFLVDQSTSMRDPFGAQPGKKKSEGVADAINRLLQNLVLKCPKSEVARAYSHGGAIGYGPRVSPALAEPPPNQPLVPISVIANAPLRVEDRKRTVDDGAGGLIEQSFRFPVWFEPRANGK